MKTIGMNVKGVEPGNFDVKTANERGLDIFQGDLEDVKYKSNFFDIITLNHVLEHMDNPGESIKELRRILKNDGTLIISLPNTNSLAYKMFGKNWYQLDVPRHLINYSEKSLRALLDNNKVRITKVRYNSRPNQFSVSLRYMLNLKKNSFLERVVYILSIIPTWITNLTKTADQIEVYCVKDKK
jgi:2-polyprenyl-3-methyl-5-hydroxy-6-metoxy-1,4-benzoquinol methylase